LLWRHLIRVYTDGWRARNLRGGFIENFWSWI
jgi:hypothetical protein